MVPDGLENGVRDSHYDSWVEEPSRERDNEIARTARNPSLEIGQQP